MHATNATKEAYCSVNDGSTAISFLFAGHSIHKRDDHIVCVDFTQSLAFNQKQSQQTQLNF